jgi:hypothetical protein
MLASQDARTPEMQGRRRSVDMHIWSAGRKIRMQPGLSNGATDGGRKTTAEEPYAEHILNVAILDAEISTGYEEYLAIFDHFYADDVQVSSEIQAEPLVGKTKVRSLLASFLYPIHVFAEIGDLKVTIQQEPIAGDTPGETHSAWVLELCGVTGSTCTLRWCARRRWQGTRVVSEHHYDYRQTGGPITIYDLHFGLFGGHQSSEAGLKRLQ